MCYFLIFHKVRLVPIIKQKPKAECWESIEPPQLAVEKPMRVSTCIANTIIKSTMEIVQSLKGGLPMRLTTLKWKLAKNTNSTSKMQVCI